MNKTTKQVLNNISKNKDRAFKILSIESFDVYLFLNEEFKNSEDISKNYLFQFIFRSFYRLDNAGLSTEFKYRYFELLQEYRNKPIDLKKICLDLNEYKTKKGLNSIQFSFTTKLANIINDRYPIYDSEVIRLFDFKQPYYVKDKNEKIEKYLNQYHEIESTTKDLLLNEEIESILNSMDNIFGKSCMKMGKMKKLDTLMWGIGKVL